MSSAFLALPLTPTNSDTALATKKILTINQPEPWEDINIQFAVKNP